MESIGVSFERCDHPAVFTCEEAERLVGPLGGAKLKNIFLRDRSGKRNFLVVLSYSKRVDIAALGEKLGAGKLSFGSPDRLRRYLGVDPGAVTILGLLNDRERSVELVIDRELWNSAESFQCHPLVNTATVVIEKHGFERFLEKTGHRPLFLDLPETILSQR